ncbi:hypothetical protein TRVA0_039S00254 [Trichomonascus vanleenenianus]|uniref:Rts3p n=1 Tax=Trichomonascus vanleenenianus TaxID=2268995 RepID=UPI003ECA39A6
MTIASVESRGRRSSSSASGRNPFKAPMRGPSAEPTKFPAPMNNAEIYDTMEKEQEAMVNKLQREISNLRSERSRSRSQSTSSSSSVSRHASIRSVYSISDAEELASRPGAYRSSRPSFGAVAGAPAVDDSSLLVSLRKENELLKKKLADLNVKVAEKDAEIKRLEGAVGKST